MTPEIIAQANVIVATPEDWDPLTCGDFHQFGAWKFPDATLSAWRPSPEELALLNGGGVVIIRTLHAEAIPVTVDVGQTRWANEGMAQA